MRRPLATFAALAALLLAGGREAAAVTVDVPGFTLDATFATGLPANVATTGPDALGLAAAPYAFDTFPAGTLFVGFGGGNAAGSRGIWTVGPNGGTLTRWIDRPGSAVELRFSPSGWPGWGSNLFAVDDYTGNGNQSATEDGNNALVRITSSGGVGTATELAGQPQLSDQPHGGTFGPDAGGFTGSFYTTSQAGTIYVSDSAGGARTSASRPAPARAWSPPRRPSGRSRWRRASATSSPSTPRSRSSRTSSSPRGRSRSARAGSSPWAAAWP